MGILYPETITKITIYQILLCYLDNKCKQVLNWHNNAYLSKLNIRKINNEIKK